MLPTTVQYEKENNFPGIWFSLFQDPKNLAVKQSAAHIGASEGRTGALQATGANWSITSNHKSLLYRCFPPP